MRKHCIFLVFLAILITLVFPTVIITEAQPQFLDIGDGETMVVINGDIEESNLDDSSDSTPPASAQSQ